VLPAFSRVGFGIKVSKFGMTDLLTLCVATAFQNTLLKQNNVRRRKKLDIG